MTDEQYEALSKRLDTVELPTNAKDKSGVVGPTLAGGNIISTHCRGGKTIELKPGECAIILRPNKDQPMAQEFEMIRTGIETATKAKEFVSMEMLTLMTTMTVPLVFQIAHAAADEGMARVEPGYDNFRNQAPEQIISQISELADRYSK